MLNLKNVREMKKTIIAISLDDIVTQVLARTAVRHHMSADCPPVLTADQAPALKLMAKSGFGMLCLALLSVVEDCDVDNDDVLSLHVCVPRQADTMALRLLMEQAVVCHIFSQVYHGTDYSGLARTYLEEFDSLSTRLRSMARGGGACQATIRPAWM